MAQPAKPPGENVRGARARNNMKILAFDTSTKYMSVALLEAGRTVLEFHEEAGTRHSEMLIPVIGDLLGQEGWSIRDIDRIVAGTGPGSFTGLRIAVATAKALAAVTGCDVAGVPSMDAMIRNFMPFSGRQSAFMDARKGKVYCCIYERNGKDVIRITDHMLIAADDLLAGIRERTVFAGDAVDIYKKDLERHPFAEYIENADWYPRAVWIGRLGAAISRDELREVGDLEPLYLHAKECNITHRRGGEIRK